MLGEAKEQHLLDPASRIADNRRVSGGSTSRVGGVRQNKRAAPPLVGLDVRLSPHPALMQTLALGIHRVMRSVRLRCS